MNWIYAKTHTRTGSFIACHGLILAALVLPAVVVSGQLSGIHWSVTAGFGILTLLMIATVLLHMGTHNTHATCQNPRHNKTADDLKKRRYRLTLTFARTWPYTAAIYLTVMFVLPFLLPNPGDTDHTEISWKALTYSLGTGLLGTAYISALLFRARNAHHLPPRTPSRARQKIEPAIRRICHRSHWAVVAAGTFWITALVLVSPDGPGASLYGIANVLLIGAYYADARHSQNLCEPCVAEFRVDAPEYAKSKNWVFTLDHRTTGKVMLLALAIVAIQFTSDSETLKDVLSGVITVILVTQTFIHRFHRRYQPWCPICHPRGDGGGEHTEVPDPTGGHGRPVPA